MAKYEKSFKGDYNEFLTWIDNEIAKSSVSTTYEDGSDMNTGDINLAVRVYERYSMAGGNRVSLNITILGNGNDLFVSAITSGGSQAVLFKVNTFGESAFLDICINAMEEYIAGY